MPTPGLSFHPHSPLAFSLFYSSSGILLPRHSSFPRTSLLFPFLRLFQPKHYSPLLTCILPSSNPSFRHTSVLSCPLQQFTPAFHRHPILAVSLVSSSTGIILPSCIYPISTHIFMLTFQLLALCMSCNSISPSTSFNQITPLYPSNYIIFIDPFPHFQELFSFTQQRFTEPLPCARP